MALVVNPRKVETNIDKAALFELLDYKPHEKQQLFHDSDARFRTPCCGRRFGKSMMVARDLEPKLFVPHSWHWIVGPDYSLGEKEFRIIHNDLVNKLRLGKDLRVSYNPKQGSMHIKFPWHTTLEVKSAERKNSLVGEGLDHLILSEAALHTSDTWGMFLEPALTDKRGSADFPSTPRGFNWYQGQWQLGQIDDTGIYKSWRFPSWDNPYVYPGGRHDPEIIRLQSNVSEMFFAQEIAAEFTSFVGKIYDEWDVDIHVKHIDYNPQWRNYLSMDFGFTEPFVALDIMVDPAENVYVWREYQKSYLSTYEHAQYLRSRENPDGYHCDGMYGDPRGADEIATINLVLGFVLARAVPWMPGIEAVKRWMKPQGPNKQPKLFIDASCVNLIRQLEMLRCLESKEGRNAKEGQHPHDDHGPDALRYFFSEYFILGAGTHLSDVYGKAYGGSEAETFFKTEANKFLLNTERKIGYY